jgi:serine/threonine protein kinase
MPCSNVLLDEDLGAHISDLGLARFVGSGTLSAHAFSLTHAAPEQVLGQRCTLAADVYSFGVLLIELATGQAVTRRSSWRLPVAPGECSQASMPRDSAMLLHNA